MKQSPVAIGAVLIAAATATAGEVKEQTALMEKAAESYRPEDPALLALVKRSNADYPHWTQPDPVLIGEIKRWSETSLIPVFDGNDVRAKEAIAIFEKAFGRPLFEAMTSEQAVLSKKKGIIFSIGTAQPANDEPVSKNCKGNVSYAKGSKQTAYNLADRATGEFVRIAWVNLDCEDKEKGGIADLSIAVHELGHAIGIGYELYNPGKNEPPVSEKFWHVLWKIYELPIRHKL
jgi:hypothetical protein